MRLLICLLYSLLLLLTTSRAAADSPERAALVFSDLPLFWAAYDAATQAPSEQRAAIFEREYLAKGSPGLRAFTRLRIENAEQLVATINQHPRYYASLRARTEHLSEIEAPIRAVLRKMHVLLPDARFPPVYFLIGRMNSGGTIADEGLLIGVDLYGRADDTPLEELDDWHRAVIGQTDKLTHIVAHELVHFQQRNRMGEQPTLLAMSVNEGVADFIGELSSGRHINHHVHAWAEPQAAELWREFQTVMHGQETKGWLYDTSTAPARPADLGYWMGYRIAKAYYDRALDKAEALQDMLAIRDFDAFLAASGVAESFSD